MVLVSGKNARCGSFSVAAGRKTAVLSDSSSISTTSTNCDIAELPTQCVNKNKTKKLPESITNSYYLLVGLSLPLLVGRMWLLIWLCVMKSEISDCELE
jgi:hypothetical protein